MADRGEYRAIRRVLLDGPDFQALPERARWVFVALKLNFGVAGIEVWYPGELVARLSAQTGVSAAGIQDALMTLERDGWIEREGNVVWIVKQFEHDPHIKVADKKHRLMIQRHVEGLPRLAIVNRFVRAYEGWFKENGEPTEALTRALSAPSEGPRSTEDRGQKTEDIHTASDDALREPRPAGEYPAEFDALWTVYPKRAGGNSKREAHSAWRARLRAGVPCEVLHAGVERYRAYCEAEGSVGGRYVMQGSTFFGTGEHYLELWTPGTAKGGKAPVMEIVDGWYVDKVLA